MYGGIAYCNAGALQFKECYISSSVVFPVSVVDL